MVDTKESECPAKCERLLRQILTAVLELQAMVSQLGPVTHKPTVFQELEAIKAQGGDIREFLKERGREQVRASRKKSR